MPQAQKFKQEEMLTVNQVRKMIPGENGGSCSRQHVYNLIEREELTPAFRFGRRRGICVPRTAVQEYIGRCRIDPGA